MSKSKKKDAIPGIVRILVDQMAKLQKENQLFKDLFKSLYTRNPVPGWKSKLLRLGIDIDDDTQSKV